MLEAAARRSKRMQTTARTTVVGIFMDTIQAKQAVKQLLQADICAERIVFVVHRNMFTPNGISQEDAVYYRHALEAGYPIVTVQADDQVAQVEHILHDNGAYNAKQPIRTLHENHVPTYPDDHGIQSAFVPYGTHR